MITYLKNEKKIAMLVLTPIRSKELAWPIARLAPRLTTLRCIGGESMSTCVTLTDLGIVLTVSRARRQKSLPLGQLVIIILFVFSVSAA